MYKKLILLSSGMYPWLDHRAPNTNTFHPFHF